MLVCAYFPPHGYPIPKYAKHRFSVKAVTVLRWRVSRYSADVGHLHRNLGWGRLFRSGGRALTSSPPTVPINPLDLAVLYVSDLGRALKPIIGFNRD